MRPSSLVARVGWGAAAAAAFSALVAAVVTGALSAALLQQAEDRRLRDAAMILAYELGEGSADVGRVEEVVEDELAETDHTGLLFAVLAGDNRFLAGDRRIASSGHWQNADSCRTEAQGGLRVCRTTSHHGLIALAASAHARPTALFAWSVAIAALLAGAVAVLLGRPIARIAVAPLVRLRTQLAALDVDARPSPNLGPPEHVEEVDQLRATVDQLLERVHQSIDQAQRFAANAAHELRTPLTTVRAELELLIADQSLPNNSVSQIARVEQHVAALALVVERLLVLTTPKGYSADASELVSLRDVTEDAVAALGAEQRKRVRTSDSDALVRGDAVLLQTMMANALSNALKFGTQVAVDIQCSTHEAIVLVDDDGPGVLQADRERIFEPFVRVSSSPVARVPGHGLGLALIRHIAEAHGGRAAFVNDAPCTRLLIRLPIDSRDNAT